jgi:hypothetical protein
MRGSLRAILTGQRQPGLYRWLARTRPGTAARIAEQAGWRCFYLDGRSITSKAGFLRIGASALHFPSYAGHNWDAFEECLNDLHWAPAQGYLVLYDFADHFALEAPADWATARAILADAAQRWQAAGIPFFALVRGHAEALLDLPELA